MKKILVTGNKGFIGKRLQDRLIDLGYDVHGIDSEYFESDDWTSELINILDFIKPDFVFHVGACSDTMEQNANYMMTRNYESTKIISDWCFKHYRILIYSSSAANYGSDGKFPSNLYGWSKYVAEEYVLNKKNAVALRYFNVYGPGESHKGKMASVAFNSFVKKMNGFPVELFPLKPKRDFIYIEDVISANIFVLENYLNIPKAYYEVGYGVARQFEDVLDGLKIPYTYTSENLIPSGYQFYTCSSRDKWLPGWQPKFDLETGIKDYLKFLESTHVN